MAAIATHGGNLALANTGSVTGSSVNLNANGPGNSIILNGAVNGGAGRVTLNAAAGATQNAAGVITASGLELLGGAASNYTLNTATNQVNTLAGNAGAVSLRDGTALSVGAAGGSTGLTAGGNVALQTTAGGIALQKTLDAGSGNVSLDSFAGITEDAGASGGILKTTGTLLGSAATSAILDNASNAVAALGDFATGSGFTLNDADGGLTLTGAVHGGTGATSISTAGGQLTLGAWNVDGEGVTLQGAGVTNAAGSTVDGGAGDIVVFGYDGTTAGPIDMAGALTTTSNRATAVQILNATTAALGDITTGATGITTLGVSDNPLTGAVTQIGVITTGTLLGFTGGTVNLDGDNTIANIGNFTNNGAFTLNDIIGLNVTGTVNTVGAASTITVKGNLSVTTGAVTASGVNLTTTGTGNAITLHGNVSGGAGNVVLNSSGGAVENAGGTVTGVGLQLLGAGPFELSQVGNHIATLAANTSGGSIAFKNDGAFDVGTVNGTVGIVSTNQAVDLSAGGA